jgi:hypothetical protein
MALSKIMFGAALVLGTFATQGCAAPATAQGMTVTAADIGKDKAPEELAGALRVQEISGGSETHAVDQTKIADRDFEKALEASLQAAGLLAKSGSSRYEVKATLLRLEQPMAGIDMTVITHVHYVVVERKGGRAVFDETIVAAYTAHLGDSAIGMTRMRLATEGAARKSIASFIEKVKTTKIEKAVARR